MGIPARDVGLVAYMVAVESGTLLVCRAEVPGSSRHYKSVSKPVPFQFDCVDLFP